MTLQNRNFRARLGLREADMADDKRSELPDSAALDLTEAVGAKGATGRRITLTSIKNNIAQVHYVVPGDYLDQPDDSPLNRLTLCLITTWQGFVVVGKSAPMDPTNFNAEKGRLFAYEDAIRQMWPLMAFAELERRGASL
jgi:hypothetical protein